MADDSQNVQQSTPMQGLPDQATMSGMDALGPDQSAMPAGWAPGGSIPPPVGPNQPANPFLDQLSIPAATPPSGKPNVMLSILGTFLSGVEASLAAPRGQAGAAQAAQMGARMGQQWANPDPYLAQKKQAAQLSAQQALQEQQISLQTKKAQLAMLQINLQKEAMLMGTMGPELRDAKYKSWEAIGNTVIANVGNGKGEIEFQTQDPKALYSQWQSALKNGDYNVIPFVVPGSSYDKPTYGLYHFKDSDQWSGPSSVDVGTKEDPFVINLPNGGQGMKTSDVLRYITSKSADHTRKIIADDKNRFSFNNLLTKEEFAENIAKLNNKSREDQTNLRGQWALKVAQAKQQGATTQTRAQAEFSQAVLDQIDGKGLKLTPEEEQLMPEFKGQPLSMNGVINAIDAKLGPGTGRWNDWFVNKAGANDPAFAYLDQRLDLLASAIVRAHFGARGGQGYREQLKKSFGEAQSAADLKARIAAADQVLAGYANQIKPTGGGNQPAGTTTPGNRNSQGIYIP